MIFQSPGCLKRMANFTQLLNNQLGCALIFLLFFPPFLSFFSHYSVQSHSCSQACVIIEMPELFYKRESWSFITQRQRWRGGGEGTKYGLWATCGVWKYSPESFCFPLTAGSEESVIDCGFSLQEKNTNDQQFLVICQRRIRCKEIKGLWAILI